MSLSSSARDRGSSRGYILIVDDDPNVRDVLHEYLSAAGYDVEIVGTAAAALTAIGARLPDVVLLDLRLPGVLGGEAVVGPIAKKVPVIVITGEIEVELKQQTLRDGAFEILEKPFDLARVRQTIAAAMLR